MKKSLKFYLFLIIPIILIVISAFLFTEFKTKFFSFFIKSQINNVEIALLPSKDSSGKVLYTGKIYHIFFHSLVIYPEMAFKNNSRSDLYQNYMITKDEFKKILPKLYENNFVLIDINSIYTRNKDGSIKRKGLYLPENKKPLIISLDDLSYYSSQKNSGFANKLVFDKEGNVATEVLTPEGQIKITRDGDIVPILDDFIKTHPDFSINGAKGIIAVTGYDGVLGYRTEAANSKNYFDEVLSAKKIVDKLKNTGWIFASHSYSHESSFSDNTISVEEVKKDTEKWDKEVRPIVGDTNIFVGPFGEIFKPKDIRREVLISDGFNILFGVGMMPYLQYFNNYIAMDRADIDGYRLIHSQPLLRLYFDPSGVIDSLRPLAE